jgi:hypothetical protein
MVLAPSFPCAGRRQCDDHSNGHLPMGLDLAGTLRQSRRHELEDHHHRLGGVSGASAVPPTNLTLALGGLGPLSGVRIRAVANNPEKG